MHSNSLAVALSISCVCLSAALAAEPTRKPDYQRGWRLHDDACTGCHGASMYSRPEHERNPYFTVKQQTKIWQEFVGLTWSGADVEDVAYYVQTTFYEKTCTPSTCK